MYGYTDTSGVGERVSQVVTNNVSPVRCAVISEACALSSVSREGLCASKQPAKAASKAAAGKR